MRKYLISALVPILLAAPTFAADVQMLLPLGRSAYQTNEWIDLAVVRSDKAALSAGKMTLTLNGADGSRLAFSFPVKEAQLVGKDARAVEHLRINGWLLRPGQYTAEMACDGASAQKSFTVYSHLRQSSYRLIHWGGSKNNMMTIEGENGLGFNLAMGETGEQSIVSGQDVMGTCLMGGGHQHDLRASNDWSDPHVYLGAIQRGVDRAFEFRTQPNAIGAHLHDEPGLTWLPHPRMKDKDGKPIVGPYDILVQRAAYKRAYGKEPIWFDEADTKDPRKLEEWARVNDFRLGFMDAYWKASRQTLDKMKPGYLSVTQSQYGWNALYDGYYFNVARSLPVISGHGGYSDYWLFNLNPSFYLEASLPRQLDRPTWYLPEWGSTDLNGRREIQNLSFITGIQGIAQWPGINIDSPHVGAVVETNKIYARLGPIFTKPAYTRQPLAILYSKSNVYFNKGHTQMEDLAALYVATRLTQHPINFVLEEDILDGTLAASHKAVIVAGVTHLDAAVVAGLEAFADQGGTVLTTADTKVAIKGAAKLDMVPGQLNSAAEEGLKKITDAAARKTAEQKVRSFRAWLEYAEPTAKALREMLLAKEIKPAFECDVPTIAPGRQVRGGIEYLFAVNMTPTAGYGGFGKPTSTTATLSLPHDGRPVYNAITVGPAPFTSQGKKLTATLNFGPGQMLAFARPSRPIGGVQVGLPVVSRDLTLEVKAPIHVEFAAMLMDKESRVIAGTAPLQITVTDPLGVVRYDLFRATDRGVCSLSLPLAVNDAAGQWTIAVKDLLNHTTGTATFDYRPAPQCGAAAGMSRRALFFAPDAANVYNFFRSHRQISIVAGSSDYDAAAAKRLAEALKPYNVTATIVPLADANKARPLTDEEAKTWCGTSVAGDIDKNTRNNPHAVGYNLPQPTVLLGNANDNPLIKRLQDTKVLPYAPKADLPGRGRGLIAWNVMTLGHDVEAIALIADDEAGLSEAVGTLFTLAAGIEPVTPLALPLSSQIKPASLATGKLPPLKLVWQKTLSDRIDAIVLADGQIIATAANGVQTTLDLQGKLLNSQNAKLVERPKLSADVSKLPKETLHGELRVKQVLRGTEQTAVIYWGGRLQVFDGSGALKAEQQLPQDITAMAWDSETLIIGTADGVLARLRP